MWREFRVVAQQLYRRKLVQFRFFLLLLPIEFTLERTQYLQYKRLHLTQFNSIICLFRVENYYDFFLACFVSHELKISWNDMLTDREYII